MEEEQRREGSALDMEGEQHKEENYENMIKEALSRIPVYTQEWTSRLPSDPGITVLENLSAFTLLLHKKLDEVPPGIVPKLLKLTGFLPREGRSARVLLQPELIKKELLLPKGQKFYAGKSCYETNRQIRVWPGKLKRVFREGREGLQEIQELSHGNPLSAHIFGEQPKAGDRVYFLFDQLRAVPGESIRLYVTTQEPYQRNPQGCALDYDFAKAKWSYYTEDGYKEADCTDETGVFLVSGEMTFRLGSTPPAMREIQGHKGYLLCCTLLRAGYDINPRVTGIDGPLLEVFERDTKSLCKGFPWQKELHIPFTFPGKMYWWAYVKAGDGYRECASEKAFREGKTGNFVKERKGELVILPPGNCCEGEPLPHTELPLPEKQQTAAVREPMADGDGHPHFRIVACGVDMLSGRELGTIQGYDREEFDVGALGRLLPEELVLMLCRFGGGEPKYYFFSPGTKAGEFSYEYDALGKCIRILDGGGFEGCTLYLAGCASCRGAGGNIRAYNTFVRQGFSGEELFNNPHQGEGGRDPEDTEALKKRFRESFSRPLCAVTAEDYAYLARQVPGLCIHKTAAFMKEGAATVYVAVKPYGDDRLPPLTETYRQRILAYLKERKMMNTAVEVIGPRYIPIHVRVTVLVKPQFSECRRQIRKLLERELDSVSGPLSFGETIRFGAVLKELKGLPFVESVQNLELFSGLEMQQKETGERDIRLPPEGLGFLGQTELDIKRSRLV